MGHPSGTLSTARCGKSVFEISGQPENSVMTIDFQLEGQSFTALNGRPLFQFTPAVSFFVHFTTRSEVDRLWGQLAPGGTVTMELDMYPFSDWYGFVKDRFGVSWQVVPRELETMMTLPDAASSERVMQAMLRMDKLDLEALPAAQRA